MSTVTAGQSVQLQIGAFDGLWVNCTGVGFIDFECKSRGTIQLTSQYQRIGFYGESVCVELRCVSGVIDYSTSPVAIEPLTAKQAGDNNDSSPLDLKLTVNQLISGGVYPTPELFGAVGDGVTDDTAALTAFFQSSSALAMPANKRYLITSPIARSGQTQLQANGSTIVTNGDFDTVGALTINIPVLNEQACTIAVINANTLPSSVATGGFVTELTVSDSSLYKAGDIVKVYSSDRVPQSPLSLDEYIGEFGSVLYVATGKIYLSSILVRTYTTSPRVALMDSSQSVSINGLRFEKSSAQPATANTKCLHVIGAVNPYVSNIFGKDTDDDLVALFGCFAPVCDNIFLSKSKASSSQSATGYALVEYSCGHGKHTRISGNGVRHTYTNGAKAVTTPATESSIYFGETMFTTVSDSVGFGCGNAAFDTHEGSYGVSFNNCRALYRFSGPSSSIPPGFANRGVNTRFKNCESYGCGFRQVSTSGTLATINSTVIGCKFDVVPTDLADTNVRLPAEVTGISTTVRSVVDIYNSEFVGYQAASVSASFATINMRSNCLVRLARFSGTSASNFFTLNNNSIVTCDNLLLDSSGTTSTTTRIGSVTDASSTINIFGGRWYGVAAGAVSFTLNNVACVARVTDFRADNTVSAAASAGSATVVQQIRTYDQLTAIV